MTDLGLTRELAVRVMGLEELEVPIPASGIPDVVALGLNMTGSGRWFAWGGRIGLVGAGALVYVWAPLARIEDAWMVRDKLAEHGMIRVSNGDGDSEDCDFYPRGGGLIGPLRPAHVTAATSARAICLCGLRSAGVEV